MTERTTTTVGMLNRRTAKAAAVLLAAQRYLPLGYEVAAPVGLLPGILEFHVAVPSALPFLACVTLDDYEIEEHQHAGFHWVELDAASLTQLHTYLDHAARRS